MAMVAAMTILRRLFLLLVLTTLAPMAAAAERGPLILAAASLQESLTDAADAWAAQGAILRRLSAGAPPDQFNPGGQNWGIAAFHPRDQLLNTTLLARLERLYQEHLGDTREALAQMAGRFQQVLGEQDPQRIDNLRASIEAQLDELERSSWR